MSGLEISLINSLLEGGKGNLKLLQKLWCCAPKIDHGVFYISKGQVEKTMLDCFSAVDSFQSNMDLLLSSTVEFFEHLGIQFSEADAAAAQDIQSVT